MSRNNYRDIIRRRKILSQKFKESEGKTGRVAKEKLNQLVDMRDMLNSQLEDFKNQHFVEVKITYQKGNIINTQEIFLPDDYDELGYREYIESELKLRVINLEVLKVIRFCDILGLPD